MAAISMSLNVHLIYDGAVSRSMADRIDGIADAYRLWTVYGLAPLRLTLSNVVEDTEPMTKTAETGLICLSGGLDSMHAAVEATEAGEVHHALFVAGLDYASDTAPGFVERRSRVEKIAESLELDMLHARSNIKDVGLNWSQMHGLNLGVCLNLFADNFGFGVFAQDNASFQDLHRHPWGNHGVLDQFMSTKRLPMITYGRDTDRVEKLRRILEAEERVIGHLSVCYEGSSAGGNCGYCKKCCQMRATFSAVGASDAGIFDEYPDLAARFRDMTIPERAADLRGLMCRTSELAAALPEGELRDAVVEYETKLQTAFIAASD
ncbi:hypothetical protein [uncultured Tateyamaria sp.]|nr:hypothetical protein [uncultured Tateyamaria sp.]